MGTLGGGQDASAPAHPSFLLFPPPKRQQVSLLAQRLSGGPAVSEMQNHLLAGSGQVSGVRGGTGGPLGLRTALGSARGVTVAQGEGTCWVGNSVMCVINAALSGRNGAAPTRPRLAPTPPPLRRASSVSTEAVGGLGAGGGVSFCPQRLG